MSADVWGLIGIVVTGLVGAVAYLGKYILAKADANLAAMTADRDWWRDRYFSTKELAETATGRLERSRSKGA